MASLKGVPKSAHMREALSATLKGRKFSAERREALRIGQVRRRERERANKPMTACEMCGTVFIAMSSSGTGMKPGRKRFCSRSCSSRRKRQPAHVGRLQEFMRNCIHRFGVNTKGLEAFRRHSTHILGYTKEDLRARLESLFQEGMSWDNYGGRQHGRGQRWVIDHIHPIAAFIREGVKDPKIVNALSNLQPMWSRENTVKHAKVA
jgi:hypothetical protein